VHALLERVPQDSPTASRPPSSDPPQRRRSRRQPSGRRPGGQPGHRGQTRRLVPAADVDVMRPLKPEPCARGQQPLRGDDPQPQRHPGRALPPRRPEVPAYPWHPLVCPLCGARPRAAWPAAGPTRADGPRVQAITARCTGASRLSQRTTQQLLPALCGVTRRLGTVRQGEAAPVDAVAAPVDAARSDVPEPARVSLDDTGGRQGDQRAGWGGRAPLGHGVSGPSVAGGARGRAHAWARRVLVSWSPSACARTPGRRGAGGRGAGRICCATSTP
jgi:transposase